MKDTEKLLDALADIVSTGKSVICPICNGVQLEVWFQECDSPPRKKQYLQDVIIAGRAYICHTKRGSKENNYVSIYLCRPWEI